MSTEIASCEQLELQRRTSEIAGLRELADFLEVHPNVPMPYVSTVNAYVRDREALQRVVREVGSVEKGADDNYMYVRRQFSGVSYEINIRRELVCAKRVVGTRTVPEHTEEIVEWDCGSILGETEQQ